MLALQVFQKYLSDQGEPIKLNILAIEISGIENKRGKKKKKAHVKDLPFDYYYHLVSEALHQLRSFLSAATRGRSIFLGSHGS